MVMMIKLPIAHLPHSEFENGFSTGSESATEITVGERSDQTVTVIDNKEASASFTRQFHKLIHNQIRFSAYRNVFLFLHHILHLQFKFESDKNKLGENKRRCKWNIEKGP